jgi:hypothetical protein
MHEMYLWFSIIGWAAAVVALIIIGVVACRKRDT